MTKVNSLLSQRLKVASEKLSKMTTLAEMSSSGNLSSFSGIFRISQLSDKEKKILEELLLEYKNETQDTERDLQLLFSLTSEVKAINNQAAILHGERIKKAQDILKRYRDGAFTAWLMHTYGNRQTPYNFLQYYELHLALPVELHSKLDEMPRQAVYTLASRSGAHEKKEQIVKNYQGEPKQELLSLIRKEFPLAEEDKRKENPAEQALALLLRLQSLMKQNNFSPSSKEKQAMQKLLIFLQTTLDD